MQQHADALRGKSKHYMNLGSHTGAPKEGASFSSVPQPPGNKQFKFVHAD